MTGNRFVLFKRNDGLWYWRLCREPLPPRFNRTKFAGLSVALGSNKINTVSAQRHAWCGHREMENSASRLIAPM